MAELAYRLFCHMLANLMVRKFAACLPLMVTVIAKYVH